MKHPHLSPTLQCIEVLESRIAPAAVSLSFLDQNGQAVTVTSTKGTAADLQTAVGVAPGATAPGALSFLFGAPFKGADISVIAGATALDAITTQVAFFNATGVDLGKVTIDGELDRINAGDANSATTALKALTVGSWGNNATPTAADQLDSLVIGAITSLTVKGDFTGASLQVRGSDSDAVPSTPNSTDVNGKIGSLFIGGSLVGTERANGGSILATDDISKLTVIGSIKGYSDSSPPLPASTDQDSNARILSFGTIKSLFIGTDATPGDLIGGDGDLSGQVVGIDGITKLVVKGSIKGGRGFDSGAIGAAGTIGNATVTGDLLGGDGTNSGTILGFTNITKVKIDGSIKGGDGEHSGAIGAGSSLSSIPGVVQIGAVTVGGDIVGGDGVSSGQIVSQGTIKSVTVEGSLLGGAEFESGAIGSLRGLGAILIKGDVVAGRGERSGLIATEPKIVSEDPGLTPAPIASVTILGSILGDLGDEEEGISGPRAGGIFSGGNLGPVIVSGNVIGGGGDDSGSISSGRDISRVSVGGEVRGGGGEGSGSIQSAVDLGPVAIGVNPSFDAKNLVGGAGARSGAVISGGQLARIDVFGSVLGGDGPASGSIETQGEGSLGDMGPVYVAGSLIGAGIGTAIDNGQIFSSGKLASVTIGNVKATGEDSSGNVTGGNAPGSGSISSELDMGAVKIKRNLAGGIGDESGKITSGGKLASLAVGSDKFTGSIIGGAGNYDTTADSGDQFGQVFAQGAIGSITVAGDIRGNASDQPSGRYAAHLRGFSIGTVVIGGSIAGGVGAYSGSIAAIEDLKSVKIGASLSSGNGSNSGFVAAGDTLGLFEADFVSGSTTARPRISAGHTITTVTINEAASNADILAGYEIDGGEKTADAKIGTVKIGTGTGPGTIQGTNIIAGLSRGENGFFDFGDGPITLIDDSSLTSRIASVVIKGAVNSSGVSDASYGILAQHLVALKINSAALPLTSGANNDDRKPVNSGSDTIYGERAVD